MATQCHPLPCVLLSLWPHHFPPPPSLPSPLPTSMPLCPEWHMGGSIAGPSSEVPSDACTMPDTMWSPSPKTLMHCKCPLLLIAKGKSSSQIPRILFANPPLLLVLLTSQFLYPTPVSPVYLNSSCWYNNFLKFYGYLMVAGMEQRHDNFSLWAKS